MKSVVVPERWFWYEKQIFVRPDGSKQGSYECKNGTIVPKVQVRCSAFRRPENSGRDRADTKKHEFTRENTPKMFFSEPAAAFVDRESV